MKTGLKKHYHWIVALVIFLEMLVFGGVNNTNNVFTIPLADSLKVSRGDLSLSLIPGSLIGFFSTMFTGALFSKYGYRRLITLCLLLNAGATLMMAFSQSIMLYTVSYAVYNIGTGICGATGAALIVKNWFRKHQGVLLGAVSMATGLGGSLLSVILMDIVVGSSWRYAKVFCTLLFIVCAALCFLIRNRPEEIGLTPYGADQAPGKVQKVKHADPEFPGHTTKRLMRLPQFYIMLFGTLVSCTCLYITFNVFVPHFQDIGYSPEKAASLQSILMLFLSISKLVFGWLCDRIGVKRVTVLCIVAGALGQWILVNPGSEVLTYIGILLFSLGLPMTTIIVPLLTMCLFGYRAYGVTTGVFSAMIPLANMIASPIANYFYDASSSYVIVFQGSAIMNLGTLGLYFLLFSLCKRDKTRQLNAIAQLH